MQNCVVIKNCTPDITVSFLGKQMKEKLIYITKKCMKEMLIIINVHLRISQTNKLK